MPLAVHQYYRGFGLCGDLGHGRIVPQGTNVVDNIGPRLKGPVRHLGLDRINRDGHIALAAETLDDRDNPGALLGDRDVLGDPVHRRPRRFAAYIDNRRPFLYHLQAALHREPSARSSDPRRKTNRASH